MDILDIGPFKKISVPPDWRRSTVKIPQANRGELPVLQLTMPGREEDLEIGIFYRGKLESEADGENFRALLQQHKSIDTAVTLTPGQIRSLSRILDLTGFNQYTFPRHLTGYNPDFQLRSAQVFVLNARPVLKIDGEFRAESLPDTFFAGIYVDADNNGRKIYELYFKASERDFFLKGMGTFRKVAESIEWAATE